MPSCELCGTDVDSLIPAKISGAEIDVCPNCTKHGQSIDNNSEDSKSNTKYSTKTKSTTDTDTNQSQPPTEHNNESQDDFDMETLALNYGEKIRDARNSAGFTRAELANKMDIKESHLKNIEKEKTQPDITLQEALETRLGIDLSAEDINYED